MNLVLPDKAYCACPAKLMKKRLEQEEQYGSII